MLQAINIGKRFGSRVVFEDWSHAWPTPGVHLVAGANGVGKSTLLALIAGALEADQGDVLVAGASLRKYPGQARTMLSYCPANCPVFPFLRGRDWLAFTRGIRGSWNRERSRQLFDAFRLQDYQDTRFAQMSLGTARKFLLLSAVEADTALLILDEPSGGLDADSIAALHEVLIDGAQTRLTILSSHDYSHCRSLGIEPERTLLLQ
jgi:ABC-type multidrug transport system ATPase subunit